MKLWISVRFLKPTWYNQEVVDRVIAKPEDRDPEKWNSPRTETSQGYKDAHTTTTYPTNCELTMKFFTAKLIGTADL